MPKFAALFCDRQPHLAAFVDAHEANEQAELLRANGLQTLNDRALASPAAEVLDVIAEHNMAAVLLRRGFTEPQYEPASMHRPIDLVGSRGGRCYRIEVKRLASSQHDELHSNVMKTLNAALESHDQPVVISLQIAEAFEGEDINILVRHVKQSLREWRDGEPYYLASNEDSLACYTFKRSEEAEHPRVGVLGDMDMRDVTGDDQARVRGKVKRAYSKFKVLPADDAVHLVVLEGDNMLHPHAVSEALYGREYVDFIGGGGMAQGRLPDGAFSRGAYSRIGGVVVARRVAHRLFVPYKFTLFPNPGAVLPLDEVVQALDVPEVLGPNDYP